MLTLQTLTYEGNDQAIKQPGLMGELQQQRNKNDPPFGRTIITS